MFMMSLYNNEKYIKSISEITTLKFSDFNKLKNREKQSRNSRLDSLFTILGIQERRYDGNIDNIFKDIDYDKVEDKLKVKG